MTARKSHIARKIAAAAAAALMSGAPALAGPAPAPAPSEEPSGPRGRVLVGEGVDSYVRMDVVRAAVLVDPMSGTRATLDVSLSLDAPERGARRTIEQRRLWLRAAYSETLLIYGGRLYRWGDVPDLDRLGAMLQDDTDRLLGAGQAEVLLDSVVIHAG